MGLEARSSPEASCLVVVQLSQIRDAGFLLLVGQFDVPLVAELERVGKPIEEPRLARVLTDHPRRELRQHLVRVLGVSSRMELNIDLLVELVGGLWIEGAVTRALKQLQNKLTNLNCVFRGA